MGSLRSWRPTPSRRSTSRVAWNSPDQILWAFEAVAGLKLEGTDKETLPAVDHPMAVALLEYRQALDVYKRFRETKVVDGRVYAKWNQLKAKTGRMSCEKPPLQGIPKPLRRAFVAPDGHALVVSDLSQIEIRVLAALCGDERLLSDLAAGRDMHRTAAASVFGKDYEAVTDAERKLCKGLVFGTLYSVGLNGFTARVNAWTGKKYSPDEVDRRFRKPLFAAYPKVQKWMDRTLKAHEDGKTVAYTPLGRRRLQVSSGPEALNTPIQAGALDVMKAIACAAYERRSELSTDAVQSWAWYTTRWWSWHRMITPPRWRIGSAKSCEPSVRKPRTWTPWKAEGCRSRPGPRYAARGPRRSRNAARKEARNRGW